LLTEGAEWGCYRLPVLEIFSGRAEHPGDPIWSRPWFIQHGGRRWTGKDGVKWSTPLPLPSLEFVSDDDDKFIQAIFVKFCENKPFTIFYVCCCAKMNLAHSCFIGFTDFKPKCFGSTSALHSYSSYFMSRFAAVTAYDHHEAVSHNEEIE